MIISVYILLTQLIGVWYNWQFYLTINQVAVGSRLIAILK